MSRVAVVTDTTQYLPREVIERHEISWSRCTSTGRAAPTASPTCPTTTASTTTCARQGPAEHVAAVGGGLPRRLRAADRAPATTSSRSTCPAGISGTVRRGRAGARGADRAAASTGADRRGRLAHRLRGHGFMALAAANARAAARTWRTRSPPRGAARRPARSWFAVDTLEFLRRGGRIGAARRVARLGAEDQADPHDGRRDQPVERVRTAGRAFERLVEHLQERNDDGCDEFAVQHIQAADAAERMAERGREIYGASRCSCRRSGR